MALEEFLLRMGAKTYNAYTISQEIDNLHTRITEIYKDISEGHIDSARQAFQAAVNSKSPNSEIRSAIIHLRDAYNIYKIVIPKTKRERFLFFSYNADVFSKKEQSKIYDIISRVAALICISYRGLGKSKNADRWRANALDDFDEHLRRLDYLIQRVGSAWQELDYPPDGTYLNELWKIDKKFVKSHITASAQVGRAGTHFEITSSGERYFEEDKEKQRDVFINTIDSSKLTL